MPRAPSGSLLPRAPLPSSVAGGGAAARAPSAGGERGLRELPAPGVGAARRAEQGASEVLAGGTTRLPLAFLGCLTLKLGLGHF